MAKRLAKNTQPVYKKAMKRKRLKSTLDIVTAFQGNAKKLSEGKRKLAIFAEVSMQAVCNWVTDGIIPNGYHYRIHLWAESKGHILDPQAVGLRKDGSVAETQNNRRAA